MKSRLLYASVKVTLFTSCFLFFSSCGWLGNVSIKGKNAANNQVGNGTDSQRDDSGTLNPPTTEVIPPKLLIFASSPVPVNACGTAFVVATKNGQATNVTSPVNVALTAPATLGLYSVPNCTGPLLNSVSVATGTSSAVFYFKAPSPSLYTVTATDTSGGYASASFTIESYVSPNTNVVHHAFLDGPMSVQAGTCAAYTVTYKNSSNADASFGSPTNVRLSNLGVGGKFYTSSSCTGAEIPSYTMPAHAISTIFYYKNELAGSNKVSVEANNLPSDLDVTVFAGPASQLALQGPVDVNLNNCVRFDVESRDAFGNVSNVVNNLPITLSRTGAGDFYGNGDNNCAGGTGAGTQINAGNSLGSFRYRSSVGPNANLTASASGMGSATKAINFIGAPTAGHKLKFVLPATSTNAGSCFGPLKVKVVDAAGADVTNAPSVNIELANDQWGGGSAGSAMFYNDGVCGGPSNPIVQTNSVFYLKDFVAEQILLTAVDQAHLLQSANEQFLIHPGAAHRLSLSSNTGTSYNAGECNKLWVRYKDFWGNNVPVTSAKTPLLSIDFNPASSDQPAPSGNFYLDGNCSSALPSSGGSSSLNFPLGRYEMEVFFRETKVGSGLLWAKDAPLNPAKLQFDVRPGRASQAKFTRKPSSINLNECSDIFELTLFDQFSNIATADVALSFALSSAGGQFYTDRSCGSLITSASFPIGSSSTIFTFKPTNPGIVICTATPPPPLIPVDTPVTVNPGPAATHLAILANDPLLNVRGSGTGTAGFCYKFKVRSEDSLGNVLPVVSTVTVNLTRQGEGKFYSDQGCTSNINSVAMSGGSSESTIFYKGTKAQTEVLSASTATLTAAPYSLGLGAGALAGLTVDGPTSAVTGDCSGPFTVKGKDAYGNFVTLANGTRINLSGNGIGNFHHDGNCNSSKLYADVVSPATTAIFWYKNIKNEDLVLRSTDSANASRYVDKPFSIRVGPAHHFMLVPGTPLTAVANTCSTIFGFQVKDQFENNIYNATAPQVFSLTQTGQVKFYDGACGAETTTATIAPGGFQTGNLSFKGPIPQVVDFWINSSQLSRNFPITITAPASAVVDLKVIPPGGTATNGPVTINHGEAVSLAWTSTGGSSCQVSPGNFPTGVSNAGASSGALTANTTFTITCAGANGAQAGVDSVAVVVRAPVPCVKQAITVANNKAFTCDKSRQNSGCDGGPAKLLTGLNLVAGDRLFLKSFSGKSIFRVYGGQVNQGWASSCPLGWKLHFVNSGGAIIGSVPEDLESYVNGVAIPSGAASVYLGYRDRLPTDYFDNEGGSRTPPAGMGSTGGCTFEFEVRVPASTTCQGCNSGCSVPPIPPPPPAEPAGPFTCNGFRVTNAMCPAGYAAYGIDDPAGDGSNTSLDCCRTPTDLLSDDTIEVTNQCPANRVVTGGGKWKLNCTLVNTDRYKVIDSANTGTISYWGSGAAGSAGSNIISRNSIPASIRTGIGQWSAGNYDTDGCIPKEFGALITGKYGKNCGDMRSGKIRYIGRPGDAANGVVPMLP